MRRAAWVLLALALLVTVASVVLQATRGRDAIAPPGGSPAGSVMGEAAAGRPAPAALDRAREMLAAIEERGGAPLPGYVGGREFHNRERRLPPGRYKEYDIHRRVPGQPRGPERLVVDRTAGRAYYTGDHYRTFVPLH